MTWARFDDQTESNRKVLKAWRAGRGPLGLWFLSIVYSSRYGLDGFVDAGWVRDMVPDTREREGFVAALVLLDLWHEHGDGWVVNDYLEYNPSADQVASTRAARAESGQRGGQRTWQKWESKKAKAKAQGEPEPRLPNGTKRRANAQARPIANAIANAMAPLANAHAGPRANAMPPRANARAGEQTGEQTL